MVKFILWFAPLRCCLRAGRENRPRSALSQRRPLHSLPARKRARISVDVPLVDLLRVAHEPQPRSVHTRERPLQNCNVAPFHNKLCFRVAPAVRSPAVGRRHSPFPAGRWSVLVFILGCKLSNSRKWVEHDRSCDGSSGPSISLCTHHPHAASDIPHYLQPLPQRSRYRLSTTSPQVFTPIHLTSAQLTSNYIVISASTTPLPPSDCVCTAETPGRKRECVLPLP
jgi:hypothetical protein